MAPDPGSGLFALRFWPGYTVLGGFILFWGLVIGGIRSGAGTLAKSSALDDGYALAGWNVGTGLSAAFLGLLGMAGLWLLRKSRPLWPELRAWASRGPKN